MKPTFELAQQEYEKACNKVDYVQNKLDYHKSQGNTDRIEYNKQRLQRALKWREDAYLDCKELDPDEQEKTTPPTQGNIQDFKDDSPEPVTSSKQLEERNMVTVQEKDGSLWPHAVVQSSGLKVLVYPAPKEVVVDGQKPPSKSGQPNDWIDEPNTRTFTYRRSTGTFYERGAKDATLFLPTDEHLTYYHDAS